MTSEKNNQLFLKQKILEKKKKSFAEQTTLKEHQWCN